MAFYRKLGKAADQRKALLRNQVSNLLWYGKITTTEARAKEIRKLVDKYILLAVNTYDKSEVLTKNVNNEKGQTIELQVTNDLPEKLAARRQMMSFFYEMQDAKKADETPSEYKDRVKDVNHPLVEKMFREIGPKYRKRNEELGCAGGYTRIYKAGARKGDGAEEVIIELV